MLELIVAIGLVSALLLYALTGGADFGGGIWDLLAAGPRAARQREAIAHAIGPIWEANHVWLILVVVLVFTGFPSGFAAMMTALNIPLTAMLIGIVLRGSAFVFGQYDTGRRPAQRPWRALFGIASLLTPFCQGMILGALATGRIRVVDGQVASGFFAGWTTPFAFGCGLFALGLFAFLSATYLTVDTRDRPDLQDDFRLRALWSGIALAPIAAAVFIASEQGAPELFRGLTRWWAPLLLGATSMCALTALAALWSRRFVLARLAAIGQVALILIGWSVAQSPHLITPDVTIGNAHAPAVTLRLLIVASAAGAVVVAPALWSLFHLFKGRASAGR